MSPQRRVRHDVTDAVLLMVFSAGASVVIALLLGLGVALLAGAA